MTAWEISLENLQQIPGHSYYKDGCCKWCGRPVVKEKNGIPLKFCGRECRVMFHRKHKQAS